MGLWKIIYQSNQNFMENFVVCSRYIGILYIGFDSFSGFVHQVEVNQEKRWTPPSAGLTMCLLKAGWKRLDLRPTNPRHYL